MSDDKCVCGCGEGWHGRGAETFCNNGFCKCPEFRDAETVKQQIKTAEAKMMNDLDKMANDAIEEQKDKWHYENGYHINLSKWKRAFDKLNMTEKSKVLDLRFVVLKEAIVCELLTFDKERTGLIATKYAPSNEVSTLVLELTSMQHQVFPRYRLFDNADAFIQIKQALTEFANSNAFFGDEKPVPRIEQHLNKYQLVAEGATREVSEWLKDSIEQIIGHEIPIYTPKRFKSEWREVCSNCNAWQFTMWAG